MQKIEPTLVRAMSLLVLAGSLGWYVWAGYRGDKKPISIQEKTLTPHDELFAIDLRSNDQGWVVGKYGLVLHTGDKGKSWKERAIGTTETLTAISFADDRHGIVVGSNGTILVTTDGGVSWRAQNLGIKNHLLGVQVLSGTEAYVVGAFGTLISSSDGGGTWRRQKLVWEKLIPRLIKESGEMEPNLNAVHFVSQKVGWVVGEFGLILHTNDGGQSWFSQRYGSGFAELYALAFQDRRTGWVVGQKGSLIKTSDGGERWEPVDLGIKRDLYAISLPGKHGVIVGDGVVFKTNNGGSTWTQIKSIEEKLWLSGVAMKSGVAIAVGESAAIRLIDLEGPGDPSTERK